MRPWCQVTSDTFIKTEWSRGGRLLDAARSAERIGGFNVISGSASRAPTPRGAGRAARTIEAFVIITVTSSDELSAPFRLFVDADLDDRRPAPNAE